MRESPWLRIFAFQSEDFTGRFLERGHVAVEKTGIGCSKPNFAVGSCGEPGGAGAPFGSTAVAVIYVGRSVLIGIQTGIPTVGVGV